MLASRSRASSTIALALACNSSLAAAPRAQESTPALSGTWKGTLRLSNDSPPTTCRYEGGAESTVLKLHSAEGSLRAILRLDAAGTPGSGCPPLSKRYEATNVVITASAVSFLDPAGHEWALGLREGRLVGLVAWKGGGQEEPLAAGFAPPGGTPPLTRLSGEVSLERTAGPEGGAEAAASSAEPAKAKGSKFWPAFLGANVVGLGAFYGIKKATDDTASGGQASCSPRYCVYGGAADPCVCNINITSGASCGVTKSGVVFGGTCNDKNLPCQADLSCNNNVCDDRVGRCPF